jgi:hypothetical protein
MGVEMETVSASGEELARAWMPAAIGFETLIVGAGAVSMGLVDVAGAPI